MDYTYDIYAEWPLEKEEFDKEVARVKSVFEEHAPKKTDSFSRYTTIQKGDYTCLINYSCYNPKDEPFEPATDSYTYYIFAYNEKDLKVRYIYCDSLENGGDDQPYYLELDWN